MMELNDRLALEQEKVNHILGINSKCSIGVDEVGRGCLAGPVVACALWIDRPEAFLPAETPFLRDSKTLSAKRRLRVYRALRQSARYATASASVAEIDQYNILQATMMAMQRAVQKLCAKLPTACEPIAIIDGNRAPSLDIPHLCAIQGDQHYVSIAAASIMAKTLRDRLMTQYHAQYPYYGWSSNAGYGTKIHLQGLKEHGVTSLHRHSFRPVREASSGYSS